MAKSGDSGAAERARQERLAAEERARAAEREAKRQADEAASRAYDERDRNR